jgi:hypothetical protein
VNSGGVDDVGRLTERLDRERRARRQAERIAEQGMRELWETNRALEARIAERTAQTELSFAAMALGHRHAAAQVVEVVAATLAALPDHPCSVAVGERLRWLADAAVVPATSDDLGPMAASPRSIGDSGLDRWQRTAARGGKLLSVIVPDDLPEVVVRWQHVIAAVDITLATVVRHGPPGSVIVDVELRGEGSCDWLDVRTEMPALVGEHVVVDHHDDDPMSFGRLGDIGPGLALAADIARSGDGHFSVLVGSSGLVVTVSVPVLPG